MNLFREKKEEAHISMPLRKELLRKLAFGKDEGAKTDVGITVDLRTSRLKNRRVEIGSHPIKDDIVGSLAQKKNLLGDMRLNDNTHPLPRRGEVDGGENGVSLSSAVAVDRNLIRAPLEILMFTKHIIR